MNNRIEAVYEQIDALNLQDPNQVTCNGREFPREYFLSKQMTDTIERLYPNASKAVRIAARAHHIERWKLARESYPMDRPGYHAWRKELARQHAATTAKILADTGFDAEYQERVSNIILKKDLKGNEESQQMEDAACLVFMEFQLHEFVHKHTTDKLIPIIQKTWAKMSEKAHAAALKIPFTKEVAGVVKQALA